MKQFETIKNVLIDTNGNLKEAKILKARYYKEMVMIYLEGIDSIEKAEEYKGCYVKIKREDASKLKENEYFIVDLLDISVFDENEVLLGKIVDIFPTGSNDVYVIKNDEGKQMLLPAIKDVVKNVDINSKKMIVKLIEGLGYEI